jgi:hypothetical protein
MNYFGLSLDPVAHDLHLGDDGDLATVRDAAAVAQHVKQHLKFWEGEWFLDTTAGVPWIRFVFVKPFDRAVAEAVVKDALLSVPGVTEILAFDAAFHPERRHFEVYGVQLQTEFDEVVTINA